jgi:hypothetical protein
MWGTPQPPSCHVLPRVHVLWFHPLDVDALLSTEQAPCIPSHVSASILANALKVTTTVANALWMALLSMAERHPVNEATLWAPVSTPIDTTLGCASLNMILASMDACTAMAERLGNVLSHVLPGLLCLDVSSGRAIDCLSTPAKRNGRLVPTPLQLPKGATIIFNTGALQLEQLSDIQLERLRELQLLVFSHKIRYSFDGGVQIPFEADVRVIVLSTRASSNILPCSMSVQLALDEGDIDGLNETEDFSQLVEIRNSLAAARSGSTSPTLSPGWSRHQNISLPQIVLEQAQNDFVERRNAARQSKSQMPTDKDFHRWLTLTRLQARGRGATTACLSDWQKAVDLDDAMRATLLIG